MEIWFPWLSIRSKTFFFFEHPEYSIKFSKKHGIVFVVIQSDVCAAPELPSGELKSIYSLKCTRGKMKKWGMLFPVTFTAQPQVTKEPLSALVDFPTCLLPLLAITFTGFWQVVIPVSSAFQKFHVLQVFLSSESILDSLKNLPPLLYWKPKKMQYFFLSHFLKKDSDEVHESQMPKIFCYFSLVPLLRDGFLASFCVFIRQLTCCWSEMP